MILISLFLKKNDLFFVNFSFFKGDKAILHDACLNGYVKVVKALLKQNINVEVKDEVFELVFD